MKLRGEEKKAKREVSGRSCNSKRKESLGGATLSSLLSALAKESRSRDVAVGASSSHSLRSRMNGLSYLHAVTPPVFSAISPASLSPTILPVSEPPRRSPMVPVIHIDHIETMLLTRRAYLLIRPHQRHRCAASGLVRYQISRRSYSSRCISAADHLTSANLKVSQPDLFTPVRRTFPEFSRKPYSTMAPIQVDSAVEKDDLFIPVRDLLQCIITTSEQSKKRKEKKTEQNKLPTLKQNHTHTHPAHRLLPIHLRHAPRAPQRRRRPPLRLPTRRLRLPQKPRHRAFHGTVGLLPLSPVLHAAAGAKRRVGVVLPARQPRLRRARPRESHTGGLRRRRRGAPTSRAGS